MAQEGPHTVLQVCETWCLWEKDASWRRLREVIAKGASVYERDVETGETPLHVAASLGCSDLIEELVRLRADVNAADSAGLTPLEMCRASRTARTLILCGADISLKRKFEHATFNMAVTVSDFQQRFAHCRIACQSLWRILRLHRPGLASRDMVGLLEAKVWATRFLPAWEVFLVN